jgi:aspartyl-tRNA(Asn)/glutamyl-tRNA(Gln) amidotransferase subunit C
MKIDLKKVDELAALARLSFTPEQKENMRIDLEKILKMCEKLNELDTTGVEPLIYIHNNTNILRADEVKPSLSKSDALKNAPKHDSDFFRVPKVIDQNK